MFGKRDDGSWKTYRVLIIDNEFYFVEYGRNSLDHVVRM
jgi:hypothetical protein